MARTRKKTAKQKAESPEAPAVTEEQIKEQETIPVEPIFGVSIPKEDMAALPAAPFRGEITLVDHPEQVAEAVTVLRRAEMIGFDTETRPSFKRGQLFNVALLQLSAGDRCFLIRLNKIGMPEPIREILEDPAIIKIGLSTHDDFRNLHKLYQLEPAGFIELQDYVKQFKIADNSLTRIHSILFGLRISKGQRLTNWEADTLTIHQQEYAALDATACVEIYRRLHSGVFEPESSPYWRQIN